MGYIWNNWTITVVKPIIMFRQQGEVFPTNALRTNPNTTIRRWMYKRSIELKEDETLYALADITGNVDRKHDTAMKAIIKSKTRPTGGSYDDHAEDMYLEMLNRLYALAKIDNINSYAYIFADSKKLKRNRWDTTIEFNFMVTRKGVGH